MSIQGCPLRADLSAGAGCVPTLEEMAGLALLGRVFSGFSLWKPGLGE